MPRRSKTAPENSDALTDAEDLGDAYVAAPERVKPDDESTYLTLPTLILPQTLLLPRMSLPYPLDDEEETQAVDDAIKHDRLILVLAARDQDEDDDDLDDDEEDEDADSVSLDESRAGVVTSYGSLVADDELCTVGVIAEVGHKITRPGGPAHVILQGVARGVVKEIEQRRPFTLAKVKRIDDANVETLEAKAVMSHVLEQVESYIAMLPNVPEEVVTMVRSVDEPGWLADLIAFSPEFESAKRQEALESSIRSSGCATSPSSSRSGWSI